MGYTYILAETDAIHDDNDKRDVGRLLGTPLDEEEDDDD